VPALLCQECGRKQGRVKVEEGTMMGLSICGELVCKCTSREEKVHVIMEFVIFGFFSTPLFQKRWNSIII
jgi:hypothetical protein